MNKISKSEIDKRVIGCIERAKEDGAPITGGTGYYEILSGATGDFGSRYQLEIVYGSFKKVLQYAVSLPKFTGEWCSWDMPNNCNHGIIKKITIKKLR